MAQSTTYKCSNHECKKNGMVKCDGCSDRFCQEHFPKHRRQLTLAFDRICNDRDLLYQYFYSPQSSTKVNETSFTDINRWEEITIAQVRLTADNARKRVDELMQKSRSQLQRDFEQLSQELRRRKENDDYFEPDLNKLTTELEHLKLSITNSTRLIEIRNRNIDWSTLLDIEVIATETCSIMSAPSAPQKYVEKAKRGTATLFDDTFLLSDEYQLKVNEFYGKSNQRWQLIYRASRHGFGAEDFHGRCNDQGATVTVIRSKNGYLFGGYTRVPWKSDGGWKEDASSFLFTLSNPHSIPPRKYHVDSQQSKYAVRHRADYGSAFGGGCDLFVSHKSNENSDSYTNFPCSYMDTTGKREKTFTGAKYFTIFDIEVFRVV
ncbi:unnamed protein product [Didymodactylos carnosus]|uniref:TLDc domain-containing protein n=1 Tax=Didymodactylos carnosus TaxID=1234261 RepID=A0A8S2J0M0_9BILA|nr:unnamed protein product [Didymodactylos carnosus]CAF3786277.1 unnamed protein product [Didymodactylos carnosus]